MPAKQKPQRNPNAAKVSTVSESGATINIGKNARDCRRTFPLPYFPNLPLVWRQERDA